MEKINDLYNKIGQNLLLLMPEDSESISYFAQIYNSFSGFMIMYTKDQNSEYLNFLDKEKVADEVMLFLKDLRKQDIFKSEPWTQCQFNLTSDGEFSIKFAYIDEEDSYGGLYLRGISDLAKDELYEFNVPEDLWLEMKKKYGK